MIRGPRLLPLLPLACALGAPLAAQREVAVLHGLELGHPPQQGFGHTLALAGDTALVGFLLDPSTPANGTGSVYVFERGPAGWQRTRRLYAKPPGQNGFYGTPAISGDHAAVSTWAKSAMAGQVHFYERVGGVWKFTQKLKPGDLEWDDEFGFACAMDGDILIVGSPKDDEQCPADPQCNSGSAYVFARGPNGWEERAKLLPSDPGRYRGFGVAVGIDGERVVVASSSGLPFWQGPWAGGAYVFDRVPGQGWVETAKLVPPEDTVGAWYGFALDIDGDRIAVGAHHQYGQRGAVHVFEHDAGGWTRTEQLLAPDSHPGQHFGTDVDLDGERLLVGANDDDERGPMAGAAYLFERGPGGWSLAGKLLGPQTEAHDWMGWVVALQGPLAMAAAPGVLYQPGLGTVHLFDLPLEVQPYCFGEACPCGNDDPLRGCANSGGRGGLLAASGTTSVGADDLVLAASGLPAHGFAVLALGGASDLLDLGDGQLCVGPGAAGVFRFPPVQIGPEGTAQWSGLVAASQASFPPGGHVGAGQTWYLQVAYRDGGGACGAGWNTSNALRATFLP